MSRTSTSSWCLSEGMASMMEERSVGSVDRMSAYISATRRGVSTRPSRPAILADALQEQADSLLDLCLVHETPQSHCRSRWRLTTPPVGHARLSLGLDTSSSPFNLLLRERLLLSAALRAAASSRARNTSSGSLPSNSAWNSVAVYRLLLHEEGGDHVQARAECSLRTFVARLVSLVDHTTDLGVDLLSRLVGVLLAHAVVPADERLSRHHGQRSTDRVLRSCRIG